MSAIGDTHKKSGRRTIIYAQELEKVNKINWEKYMKMAVIIVLIKIMM